MIREYPFLVSTFSLTAICGRLLLILLYTVYSHIIMTLTGECGLNMIIENIPLFHRAFSCAMGPIATANKEQMCSFQWLVQLLLCGTSTKHLHYVKPTLTHSFTFLSWFTESMFYRVAFVVEDGTLTMSLADVEEAAVIWVRHNYIQYTVYAQEWKKKIHISTSAADSCSSVHS